MKVLVDLADSLKWSTAREILNFCFLAALRPVQATRRLLGPVVRLNGPRPEKSLFFDFLPPQVPLRQYI